MTEDNDRELRQRFARLRDEEKQGAPDFSSLLRRPVGKRQHRTGGQRLVWLGLAAAAVLIVAIGLSRTRRSDPGYGVDLASTTWHGPTDFLLVFPDDPGLRTVPRLGELELNWRTP